MVTLELVLTFLDDLQVRATFQAVAVAIDVATARNVRTEPQMLRRDPRTRWIVEKRTRQPPVDAWPDGVPSDTRLITDGDDLAQRAAGYGRRRKP